MAQTNINQNVSKQKRLKKKKRKKRMKMTLLIIEALVILLTVIGASIFFMPNSKAFLVKAFMKCPAGRGILKALYKDDYDKNVLDKDFDKDKINAVDLGDGYTNIALFGIDPRNGEFDADTHTDTIIIVSLNNKTHDVKLVSLYRDTLLRMTTKSGKVDYEKANSAFFSNGVEGALNMINNNLDLDITEYALVNFQGLATIIDSLGGLDVTISDEELPLVNGYLTETRKITGMDAPDLTESGNVHMTGLQATAYCRIRYVTFTDEDGTEYHDDFGRTARQRSIMNKILEKSKSAGVKQLLDTADTIIKKNNVNGNKIISTNIKWSRVEDLLTVAVDCNLVGTTGYPYDVVTPGQGKKYYGYVVPEGLEQNAIQLHQYLFPDKTYEPTQMLKDINDYIIKDTGIKPPKTEGNTDETTKNNKK